MIVCDVTGGHVLCAATDGQSDGTYEGKYHRRMVVHLCVYEDDELAHHDDRISIHSPRTYK